MSPSIWPMSSALRARVWGRPFRRREPPRRPRGRERARSHELLPARELVDSSLTWSGLLRGARRRGRRRGRGLGSAGGRGGLGRARRKRRRLGSWGADRGQYGRDGVVIARELPLDEVWRFVVVVPDEELATSDARRALPDLISFSDAVANLSALGLLDCGSRRSSKVRSFRRWTTRCTSPTARHC